MGGQPNTAHEYASAIMWRGRVPMDPVGFAPDWNDRPRKEKFYRGSRLIPLPDGDYPQDGRTEDGVHGRPTSPVGFDLPSLAGMLQDSYGLTGRRLGIHANSDLGALPHYARANWSRGTASGGGLYPVAAYWVSGPSGPFGPGVHLYSTKHHALQRLAVGDYTDIVRRSLGPGVGQDTDQFLVLGIKYWQNAFKYNSFSYHAVSMDIGTVLQSWTMWARGTGRDLTAAFWFDEAPLAQALSLPPDSEGLFAVVPLPWSGTPAVTDRPAEPNHGQVRRSEDERSSIVIEFPANRMMHRRALAEAAERPQVRRLDAAAVADPRAGTTVSLPPRQPLELDVRTALRTRRSSFGRFDATRPLGQDTLGALLAAAAATAPTLDVVDAQTPALVKVYACVNHVDGVAPGIYEYDPVAHGLVEVDGADPGDFLQENYFLANYNLEQPAAVLVPTMRTAAVLDAAGDRAYRVVNATIGAVSQTVYTAAAALEVGCGVALGFDNISFAERFGIEATDEAALLIMAVGHELPRDADFRYELALVRTAPGHQENR